MESALHTILLVGFLLFAPGSYGQEVTGTTDGSNSLQPWLVGLAAVVGFLGVIFVASLINRIFFANKTKDETETRVYADVELRQTTSNMYDNLALDVAEEGPSSEAKVTDEKLTTM
ncbi:small integral membrane protein 24 [Anolis sagrei]|uniref:small integral membrane protein 24 n=1 Tax=Anolis sagrei TaxID=38937 RepID=UPI003520C67D